MARLFFLLPVYNEENNIQQLCNDLQNLSCLIECIVWINDGSNDTTLDHIYTFCKLPYHIINQPKNLGPGAAFEKGFEYLLQLDVFQNDIVITMEADNTADLNHLDRMIEESIDNELVLASVYLKDGGFDKTNIIRLIISNLANGLVRIRFGLPQKTLTSFYRIYKISLLRGIKIKFGKFCSELGFICKIELLVKASLLNARIIEVPTILRSGRRKGNSKMKIIKTTWECIKFCVFYKPKKSAT